MSSVIILWISLLLILVGILGCFIHKFPGPIMAFIGMLVFIFGTGVPVPWSGIILCALLLVISMIAEKKVIPYIAKKYSEFGNAGKWGSIIGSIIGLALIYSSGETNNAFLSVLYLILAFVILPFVLSLFFEAIARKSLSLALKPATAAFLTYFFSMILKLGVCVYSIYIIVTNGGSF